MFLPLGVASGVVVRVVFSLALLLGLGSWSVDSEAASNKSKPAVQKKKTIHASASKVKTKPQVVAKSIRATGAAKRDGGRQLQAKVKSKRLAGKFVAMAPARVVSAAARMPSINDLPLPGPNARAEDLGLRSSAVMVIDQETHKVLFDKNASAVLSIASLTKLMTALVVSDAGLSMDEHISIVQEDVDMLKNSSSRLAVGTTLTRGELMHLALMSSENRAAHALGRTFPGGIERFVESMNVKAKFLGMLDTQYVDPTGLSPRNRSSAKDLATLAGVAYERPLIRTLSTSTGYEVDTGRRVLQYRNTNQLVSNPQWDIGLQKTGYIAEAGRCLLMQVNVAGRQLIMVFLDSAGKLTRIADAERVRKWLEAQPTS